MKAVLTIEDKVGHREEIALSECLREMREAGDLAAFRANPTGYPNLRRVDQAKGVSSHAHLSDLVTGWLHGPSTEKVPSVEEFS